MVNSNEAYAQEERERIDVVNLYHRGECHSKICKNIGRLRPWLQKWIVRYITINKRNKNKWFKE